MMTIKSVEEIAVIREGGRILAGVMDEVVEMVKVGVETGEMEKRACELIKKAGGRPAFKGYELPNGELFPTALCTSINDEVVHGPALPSRKLKEGDIIGIDMGMEYPINKKGIIKNKYSKLGGFYTDMARTVAVGRVSTEAAKLIKVTEESLHAGIAKAGPGVSLSDLGEAIQRVAEAAGFSVVRDLVGHGVGHDIHEDPHIPNYKITDKSLKNMLLKPGMVIAIEPMVNAGGYRIVTLDDDFTFATADGRLSAHFEHTIAITEDGIEILTLP